MINTNNGLSAADIAAVTGNGNFGGFGGNDGAFWLLVLFLFGFGRNGWGGNSGGGVDTLYPWMNQSDQINGGFRDQMLNSGIDSIQTAVANGFAQAEASNNARQIADMNQNFANQMAVLQGFNNMQSQFADCCCENRLATVGVQNAITQDGAATRQTIANGIQSIQDKLCQLELDGVKNQLAQAERENVGLQNQLNMQNLAASQAAQTAALVADNAAHTQYVVNRVAPYPVPSYTVPNPFVNNSCGCGYANTCGCNA